MSTELLMERLVEPVAERVKELIREQPEGHHHLTGIDPHLAARLALRCTLNNHSRGFASVRSVAMEIGNAIEHEAKMRAWEKADPKVFYGVRRKLVKQRLSPPHLRRIRVNHFHKLVSERAGWTPWPSKDKKRMGLALMGVLIRQHILTDSEA